MSQIESIAEKIISLISRTSGTRLPSVKEMAGHWDVAPITVSRALTIVRDKGLIKSCGRGGVRIIREMPEPQIDNQDISHGAKKLLSDLKTGIETGKWIHNEALPKQYFFCKEYNITDRTVRKVFDRLVNDGYAFKKGRRWIAGKKQDGLTRVNERRQPAIIILMPAEDTLRKMQSTDFVDRFLQRFLRECDINHVRTFPALFEKGNPKHLVHVLPSGTDDVLAMIREKGDKYIGTLVLGNQNTVPQLSYWLRMLSSLGRPVIVADTEPNFVPYDPPVSHRLIYYCRADYESAVVKALNHLDQFRNKTIGLSRIVENCPGYMDSLLHEITSQGKMYDPVFNVAIEQEMQLFWEDYPGKETFREVIKRLGDRGIPAVRDIVRRFLDSNPGVLDKPGANKRLLDLFYRPLFPQMDRMIIITAHLIVPLFRRVPVTALVALNDVKAITYYYWLRAIGADIPGHVSLIGFGNREMLSPYPITSVDLGYDQLGYMAYHLIRDDIPVKTGRNNVLSGPVTLIDGGSVGNSSGLKDMSVLEGDVD